MGFIKLVFAYFLGSINFAYWIGEALGVDISKVYDRNLGAFNLYRATNNISISVIAGLLDVAKVYLAGKFLGHWAAFTAYLGHCYSLVSMVTSGSFRPTAIGFSGLIGLFILYPKAFFFALITFFVIEITARLVLKRRHRVFFHYFYQLFAISYSLLLFYVFTNEVPLQLIAAVGAAFPAFIYRAGVLFDIYQGSSEKALGERKWSF